MGALMEVSNTPGEMVFELGGTFLQVRIIYSTIIYVAYGW